MGEDETMNATKHTPGPWFIDQFGHVYGWMGGQQTPRGKENKSATLIDARHTESTMCDRVLMAAAPDLLAALQSALTWIDAQTGVQRVSVQDQARAALAKAGAL
jgi:hypothetical protein